MDYVEFKLWKALALVVAFFVYVFWREVTDANLPRRPERPAEDPPERVPRTPTRD